MIYHRAKHVAPDGSVSALCYKKPHAIDLKKQSWTIRDEAVTCPKCKAIILVNLALAKKEQLNSLGIAPDGNADYPREND